MIVDAHVHILPTQLRDRRAEIARDDAWFAACHEGERVIASADDLLAAMDEAHVDRAVCLAWPFATATMREETNEHLAMVQQRHPERIIAFGIVDPAAPDAGSALQRCADRGLAGVGELNCDAQGFDLDDPRVDDAARISAELGLRWTLHCSEPLGHQYAGKGSTTPQRTARFAARHPELQLICAHLGGGLPFYAHMPEVRALCRRLWFDTAAVPFLYTATAYRAVVDACGAERLLFGTDFPLLRAARYRELRDAAGLDDAELSLVMGGAAARLLGLPD